MRLLATLMLVAMAALYAAARTLEPRHLAWGYVRAFAEAAMVGGLADWFAVTALFRHPLGLPIPHTAIIPRNKDRIGDTLASFLRDNFLVPRVVARRMRGLDVAGAAGRFLANPAGEGRLRRGASRMVAHLLESLDQERLGGMVRTAVASRLEKLDAAPLIGQMLGAAITEQRHVPLLDAAIQWTGQTLVANEPMIREMVHERSGSILRWTGLDETLSNRILTALYRLLGEMADDPRHPLRQRIEQALVSLADDLQNDPETRAKVMAFKADMLANPAVTGWLSRLWEQARAGLIRATRDPEAALAGRFGEALRQLGATLEQDARLKAGINQFARRATVGAVSAYGGGIVRLVSDTVRSWDARTVTSRLEAAVGRDLQYIRINGTLVGGLVGLALHLVDRLS
ncbi:DUF445 domain-containing protein [Sphingomonas sp. XMGL2]|uniref:DUF445 domain-containing protein n=2 Tax=Sphingomonas quercus TaxID=2842451 RepID=A0ABS6BI91_9SPHN|nr:DUF445 domain-containing protein [Sphingomonas quercus]